MIALYGISNCDTVKKARKWLDASAISYHFHDYKKAGVDAAALHAWVKEFGWETLLNRRGTTWRKLPDAMKNSVVDADSAIAVMLANPSAIKRPVLDCDGRRLVGFDAAAYAKFFPI